MTVETKKPHVYADVIKAWADGATVEYYHPTLSGGNWILTRSPAWHEDYQYRVKPEPKPDIVSYTNVYPSASTGVSHETLEEANKIMQNDRVAVIKITINGETGKLKSAEVVQ